jgi:hypothetical protein
MILLLNVTFSMRSLSDALEHVLKVREMRVLFLRNNVEPFGVCT